MRIDKMLSNLKYGSRKEIHKLIKQGVIRLNEEVVSSPKTKVDIKSDIVFIFDEEVYYNDHCIVLLHKPAGYECSSVSEYYKTIYDLLEDKYKRLDLKVAGRLDQDTTGLVLLSNNGSIIHNIISPSKNVYKKYLVTVNKPFDFSLLETEYQIEDGKGMLFTPFKPFVEKLDDLSFYLSIKEGKFHQVKRMVEHFEKEVVSLHRISIGDITLDHLEEGKYKEIVLD